MAPRATVRAKSVTVEGTLVRRGSQSRRVALLVELRPCLLRERAWLQARNLEHIKCFNCGEICHFADKRPKPKKEA